MILGAYKTHNNLWAHRILRGYTLEDCQEMLFTPRVILCKAALTKSGTVLPSQLPAQVEHWHKSHRYVDL